MNLQEAVTRIFPDGIVSDDAEQRDAYVEVHELPRNAVPQNCEIVVSGLFQFDLAHECRTSYLVKADQFVLLVRILPDSATKQHAEVTLMSQAGASRPLVVH